MDVHDANNSSGFYKTIIFMMKMYTQKGEPSREKTRQIYEVDVYR